ncbi:MAG: insulinase family protein [Thermales bacterium]|nr:insulinase family protein [Thermales bacterium]
MLKPVTLKNGLTVLKLPKTGINTMLVGYVAQSGSSVESGNWPEGISHFLGRLFQYGTDKHPSPKSLNQALESVGGSFFGLTSHEISQLYMVVPTYHQYKTTSIMAEIIQHSYFEERDITKEKNNLVEFLKSSEIQHEGRVSSLALSNLYMNHPLSSPIRGSVDSVIDITRKDVLDYFAHQYRPDQSYLIFAGNFDNKGLMELIDQEWAFWNPGSRVFIPSPQVTKEDIGLLPRINYKQRGISHTDMAFSFVLDEGYLSQEAYEIKHKKDVEENEKELIIQKSQEEKLTDFAYLTVLNSILGKGFSSRLWMKGVEEENVVW